MLESVAVAATGVLPEDVHVVFGSATLGSVGHAWCSSRVTMMAGNAVKDAGMKLRALLFEAASEKLGVPVERLATAFRRVYDSRDPEKFISFIEAANLAEGKHGTLVAAGSYKPPAGTGGSYKGAGVGPTPPHSEQACVAQMSVDLETGKLTVDQNTTAHD